MAVEAKDKDLPLYTLDEVAKHNTASDCWVVVDGQVLDCTSFLDVHPGGALAITTFAGSDVTTEYNMLHTPDMIPRFAPETVIGRVEQVGGAGGDGVTLDDVAKHNTRDDCWVVVNNKILDVTDFIDRHPGGEMAIMSLAGKDASTQWNLIHPPDTIERVAPETIIGELGKPLMRPGGVTMDEVAKHNTRDDCWVVVNNKILDVTNFLDRHPGGVMAVMALAGKDASQEWNLIHQPDTIERVAPETVIGRLGEPLFGAATVENDLSAPLLGTLEARHWWGKARNTSARYGPLGPSLTYVASSVYGLYKAALVQIVVMFFWELLMTIFTVKNYKVIHDKSGLTRSALFLIFFTLIHGLGNTHLLVGPQAFNGYAYFLNHPVIWGTLFLPIELYLLAAGMMHVGVASVRTYKFKSIKMLADAGGREQLWMAISGSVIFLFLCVHLSQFRFVPEAAAPSFAFRAKWMYPFFCEDADTSCDLVTFKDLYKMEYDLFSNPLWVAFYVACVSFFASHIKSGFHKVVNAHEAIPNSLKPSARQIGTMAALFLGGLYGAFPIYCYLLPVGNWEAYDAYQAELRGM